MTLANCPVPTGTEVGTRTVMLATRASSMPASSSTPKKCRFDSANNVYILRVNQE